MDQNYRDVRATSQMKLNQKIARDGHSLRPEHIREVVEGVVQFFGCEDLDMDALVADLEGSFQTIIGSARVLVGDDSAYEPWLLKRKAEVAWPFWNRYHQYLLREKGWTQATLDSLEDITDRILDLLTDPQRPGSWDRRGMVVGHVQSGKTANYVGLISKAADAGYKLIVVLAGFHKSLRTQTQIRLEEGFLGYDRGGAAVPADGIPAAPIGVGLIDPKPRADSITTRADDGDFKRQVAKNFAINPGGHPLLFVVKKNGSVLKNLLSWVEWAANARDDQGRRFVRDVPLLVIDDEADQGSIDTKEGAFKENGEPDPDHDPTILNQRIRQLLHLFDQSAYVGYTATPFANIFIHEKAKTEDEGEDLFPRSFIVSLPTPSDYVGPAQVFGSENEVGEAVAGLPIVRSVDDHADSLNLRESRGWIPPVHKSTHVPLVDGVDALPESLNEAILAFVLVCATRLARGHITAHNSMLIHVTRFTAVQSRVAEQVRRELNALRRRIRYGDGDSSLHARQQLRDLWERDFAPTTERIISRNPGLGVINAWPEVERHLDRAIMSITVREINGHAGEVLDYVNHVATGLNVIAIGGDKLSRGLTLEGLSVSYFLRASRMYDTLMQMGRWFGYRPGYLDLCRLYTTPDLIEWYSHIAEASEELRDDFNRMAASGGTPRDFGHRVKSHPLMMVTSDVKMRHGTKIDVTFAGDISETINFWRTRIKLEQNWRAAQKFIETVEADGHAPGDPGKRTYIGVSEAAILEFLAEYLVHPASKKVKPKLLADYIREEVQQGRLMDWTVLIATGSGDERQLGSVNCRMVERNWHLTQDSDRERLKRENHFRIRRLVSPVDEFAGLTEDQYEAALSATRVQWERDPRGRNEPTRPSGPEVRKVRPNTSGLLMLYLISPTASDSEKGVADDRVEMDAREVPIVGFAISFPYVNPEKASKVKYMVNNVYSTLELGGILDDSDEAA